ncbi:hypothetical protein [Stackebrandtia nassauensis]|nr:hypothetical protein [Stackebrandtia nassauensis]
MAAALADVTDDHAERLLDALVDAQLVESLEPERYRMHDLTGC